ncbi:MAG: histidine--tRNA ligase [Candidatus Micrarchaeia archaeon]|jgi:histidyl-tRNA synthetase
MDLTPVRGSRDFLVEEKLLRDWAMQRLKSVFERFGFNPIETPAIENWEVLSSKYAGGAEILKETYKLTDQGKRELGLRYDQTVPTCRVLAANPRLAMPFKRYSIAPVWRDGPIKLGRYREFYQCDIDTFGVQSQAAEAEIVAVLKAGFDALGIRCKLKINNRKVLDGLLESCGVSAEQATPVILSLDKLEKIGAKEVQEEMEEKGVSASSAKKVLELFDELDKLGNDELMARLEQIIKTGIGAEGLAELKQLVGYVKLYGIGDGFYEIKTSLARGLSYYSSTVFEGYVPGSIIKSSICGGGRYDEMVGKFSGKEKVPATGVAFGFESICELLKEKAAKGEKIEGIRRTAVEVFVIPIKDQPFAFEAAQALRAQGVNVAIDLLGRNITKNLDYCGKQGIQFAAIIGDKEAAEKKINLRNLVSGKETLVGLADAAAAVKRSV